MKRWIVSVLMGMWAGQASAAALPDNLPEEMVMVAPGLYAVERGLEIQRLVHGHFEPQGDQLAVTLTLLRRASSERPSPCQPDEADCLPNVAGTLTLHLNAPPDVNLAQSQALLDSPEAGSAILQEMVGRLANGPIEVTQSDGRWLIAREGGTATQWLPMRLEEAAKASYFTPSSCRPPWRQNSVWRRSWRSFTSRHRFRPGSSS